MKRRAPRSAHAAPPARLAASGRQHGWRPPRWPIVALLGAGLLLRASLAAADEAARAYVASIQPSAELQAFLDHHVDAALATDPALRRSALYVALLDLSHGDPPRLAQRHGERPVYPASVIKFVYLMAAYAWQEQGILRIDAALDTQIEDMIRESSNRATQEVFARLTDTTQGGDLAPDAYRSFRQSRLRVDQWLRTLGITDLHCVNPTYDGGSDLFGRDVQFLKDASVGSPLTGPPGAFPNRNAMTANGTVALLALLATDRALTPADSATVRRRMRRDPRQQPHLVHRIAGGAARIPGLQVYAKSGTWGPIYADAGIVQDAAGREFVLAVFTDAVPPYRGDFIADLTEQAARRLLAPASQP